ncbi:MAG: hypothetical protein V4692_03170 [Bdellovibrionota bacterium]
MRNKSTVYSLFAITFLVFVLSFNNCSQVSFSTKPNEKIGDLGEPGPNPTPPPANEAIANCQQAAAQNALLSSTQNIVFEDTRVESGRAQVCLFNQDGNLGMANDVIQARYEQGKTIALPDGAVLCGMEMQTDVQSVKYDDIFFLTFNGYIIASNHKAAAQRTAPEAITVNSQLVGIYPYDWASTRGAVFVNGQMSDYCLGVGEGLSTCQWPETEVTGQIKFDLAPELLITLGVKKTSDKQTIGFITTGDNNPADDCYHQRLELKMKAFYYLPN